MAGRWGTRSVVLQTPKNFIKSEDGLVTIEWVGIAAIVFLAALGISALLLQGADGLGGSVANRMAAAADDSGGEEETP